MVDFEMDEHMEYELDKVQSGFDQYVTDKGEMHFKPGNQQVYIEEFRMAMSKNPKHPNTPIAIMTIRGAEPGNKKKNEDIFLYFNEKNYDRVIEFFGGLGLHGFKFKELKTLMVPIIKRVFQANISVREGDGGMRFLSVKPIRFVAVTEVDDVPESELPF